MIENKVVYLLRHLGAPQKKESRLSCYNLAMREAEKHFGIHIYQQPFGQKGMADHISNRFFFRFPRYLNDQSKAVHIGESVLLGVELSFGQFTDFFSPEPIYSFPSSLFSKKGYVTISEIKEYEELKPYDQKSAEFSEEIFSACWITRSNVEIAWRMARVLYDDRNLFNGASFFQSSQEKFYVTPGQLIDIIGDNSTAKSGWEQSRLEDALINIYKTIEAVIGDIPKDDRKYFNKLVQKGIDPHELVGYSCKKELHSLIREINSERDKKSAHGKTPKRKIKIGDMLEYQECARHVLLLAIEHQLGDKVF